MEPSYEKLFKRWRPDISDAPKDGSIFMGRQTGTNRAFAVKWYEPDKSFVSGEYGPVSICQWISFSDFADIQSCVWRSF